MGFYFHHKVTNFTIRAKMDGIFQEFSEECPSF